MEKERQMFRGFMAGLKSNMNFQNLSEVFGATMAEEMALNPKDMLDSRPLIIFMEFEKLFLTLSQPEDEKEESNVFKGLTNVQQEVTLYDDQCSP